MATEYQNTCDCCGKITRAFDDSRSWGDPAYKELAKNNWDVRIYSHWLEGSNDSELLSLEKSVQVELDACLECAQRLGSTMRAEVEKIKFERAKL